ncbi:MAG: TonB-dependent receptor [Pseudolabrys sp.]|nr:TonB-dependent receptor [Pseudolabrys sp.]
MGSQGHIVKWLGASALSLVALSAQAQAPTGAVTLPEVIVVSPTTVPTPERETASSITVITGADLERDQRRTVSDALQSVPGLNVVQSGGPGGQTSVFMRGTNPNHLKVFIDGIDAGNPSTPAGNFDFAHLLAGDIERIEILRGPQSGLYGSDAIGGVISITTKKGEGPPKVTGTLETGSFRQLNGRTSLSGSQGNFNYSFNVLELQSNTPVTPLNLLPAGQPRNNDLYRNWTYSTRLGADLTDNFGVNLVARYTDAKIGITGDDFSIFPNPPPEPLRTETTFRNLFSRGEATWSLFDGRFKNFFGAAYSKQRDVTLNPNPDFAAANFVLSPLVGPPITNIGTRTKFDWRGETKIMPGQILVMGLEHQKDSLSTDSTGFTDVPFGNFFQTTTTASNWNNAGWLELQSQFNKRFFIVSNVRLDDNESFGKHSTWRVAPAFIVPGTETKLKASYGTGFKAPSLTQRYADNPFFRFTANPNLSPETSTGYDYGFEQPLWNDRIRFGSTYFHNNIKNLIASLTTDFTTFANTVVNVGQAKTSGFESFIAIAPLDRVKIRLDHTYTATKNEITDLGLLRRPANKASLSTIWNPIDPLTLSATVIYVSSWVDIGRTGDPPRLDTPPYTLVNLAANYVVDPRVTVFGRVDNLFNKQYQDPTGFMRPGVGVFGGITVANR